MAPFFNLNITKLHALLTTFTTLIEMLEKVACRCHIAGVRCDEIYDAYALLTELIMADIMRVSENAIIESHDTRASSRIPEMEVPGSINDEF